MSEGVAPTTVATLENGRLLFTTYWRDRSERRAGWPLHRLADPPTRRRMLRAVLRAPWGGRTLAREALDLVEMAAAVGSSGEVPARRGLTASAGVILLQT